MGVAFAKTAGTPQELQTVMGEAMANTAGPSLIQVKMRPHDLPTELRGA